MKSEIFDLDEYNEFNKFNNFYSYLLDKKDVISNDEFVIARTLMKKWRF